MEYEVVNYETMQKSIADFCRFLIELGISAECVFDCRLVANELLGNVLRHAQGRAHLQSKVEEGHIELTVLSSTPYTPPKKATCSDVYAENGRGLYLVDSVCIERTITPNGGIFVKIKRR